MPRLIRFLFVLVVVFVATSARAQVPGAVYSTYRVNSWTVAPAITGHDVRGFLAYLDQSAIVGSNITILWFQRQSDGSWTTQGWTDFNLGPAASWVRTQLADDTLFEQEPIINDAVQAAFAAELDPLAPKAVIKGLYFDDPVLPVVEVSDAPVELVTALVDVGWEAAPDFSPKQVEGAQVCNGDEIDPVKVFFDDLASRVEITLYGSTSISLTCVDPGCKGCERIYQDRVPAPGSRWSFRFQRVIDGRTVCYYQREAIQHWYEVGYTYVLCNTCTDSGDIDCFLYTTTTSPAGDSSCHPPAE